MTRFRITAILLLGVLPGFGFANESFSAAIQKFEAGKYQETLRLLDAYVAENDAGIPELHVFRAQTHYKLRNYPAAIQQLERGIASAKLEGTEVKKHWWELMRYLYWQEGMYEQAIGTIGEMDVVFPDPHANAKINMLEELILDRAKGV